MSDKIRSLQTRNPEEGYELAVKLSQKGIKLIQPSVKIRQKLRPKYSTNANSLITATQVISIHFQTIAAANNYWKTK